MDIRSGPTTELPTTDPWIHYQPAWRRHHEPYASAKALSPVLDTHSNLYFISQDIVYKLTTAAGRPVCIVRSMYAHLLNLEKFDDFSLVTYLACGNKRPAAFQGLGCYEGRN